MRHRSIFTLVLFALVLSSPVPADAGVEEQPLSSNKVLSLNIDKKRLEELRGSGATQFRLYVSQRDVQVVWLMGDLVYYYVVGGPGGLQTLRPDINANG